jgi:hypothetical protein
MSMVVLPGLAQTVLDALDRAEEERDTLHGMIVRERSEHSRKMALLGPPPVVDGRVLGGHAAAAAFRSELDRTIRERVVALARATRAEQERDEL